MPEEKKQRLDKEIITRQKRFNIITNKIAFLIVIVILIVIKIKYIFNELSN